MTDPELTPLIPAGHMGGGAATTEQSSQPRQPKEEHNNLVSRSFARILDMTTEGPIAGLCTRSGAVIRDNKWLGMGVYLNGTAMISPGGKEAFSGVAIAQVMGTQNQPLISGFSTAEETLNIGLVLKYAQPLNVEIVDATTTSVLVGVKVASLFKQDKKTGDINGTGVEVRVDIVLRGGAVALTKNIVIVGKTQSEYIRNVEIVLPRSGTPDTDFWTIRVTRVTFDANTVLVQNGTELSYITRVVGAQLRYPNSAIVAVQFDAQTFSSIPTRAYHLKGRLIKVPSNYYPPTRGYNRNALTGHVGGAEVPWDGTFWTTWSDNPAWCFYDLCTNTRYGLGDFLQAAQVDKWTLFQVARYCDETVPNPVNGRLEPRFTCNLYLQDRNEAVKVLTDIASIFRGFVYWASGTIVTVNDMPKVPLLTFTNGNVQEGLFIYSSTGARARHTVCLVRWNDPADFYNPKFEYVSDDDGIAQFGIRDLELTGIGCTRRGQAIRLGKWALASELNETEVVRFSTGLEGLYPKPGDIVQVLDQHRAGARMGGRLLAIALDRLSVTIDRAVTLDAGAYTLSCVLATGFVPAGTDLPDSSYIGGIRSSQLVTRVLTNAAGAGVAVLTFADALPAGVLRGSVWALESNSLKAQLFRVLQVTELEKNQYEIQGIEHNPSKFAAIDQALKLEDEQITKLPDFSKVADPLQFTATAGHNDTPEQVGLYILLSWKAPLDNNIRGYILEAQRGDGNWQPLGEFTATSHTYSYTEKGTYNFRIFTINTVGVRSTGITASVTIDIAASPVLPPDVTGLELVGSDGTGQGLDAGFVGPDAAFQWRVNSSLRSFDFGDEPMGAAGASDDPYFQEFEVGIFEPGSTSRMWYETVKSPHFVFTHAKNEQAFGSARNRFTIVVNARDTYNRAGGAATMTAVNPAPAQHLSLTVLVSFRSAFLAWVNPPDVDLDHTEVWMSSTPVFADAGLKGVVAAPGTNLSVLGLNSNANYYFWLVAVDTFGSRSNIFPEGAVHVVPGTIPQSDLDALAIDITQVFQNTISLKGAIWKDNDPMPGFISWNAHQLIFRGLVFLVAAGNSNLPYIWWRGPVYALDGVTISTPGELAYRASATHPKDGGPPEAGNENDFIVATNAESAGLHDLAWRTMANALIGSAYIRSAAIQDAHIADVAADKITAGAINSQDIAITGGAAGKIRSSGYVAGVSGWAVFGDGTAEFNDVVIRGTLDAAKVYTNSLRADKAYPANILMASIIGVSAASNFDYQYTAGATCYLTGTPGAVTRAMTVPNSAIQGKVRFYGMGIADSVLTSENVTRFNRVGTDQATIFAFVMAGTITGGQAVTIAYRVVPFTQYSPTAGTDLTAQGTVAYPWIVPASGALPPNPYVNTSGTMPLFGYVTITVPATSVVEFVMLPIDGSTLNGAAANDVITRPTLRVELVNP